MIYDATRAPSVTRSGGSSMPSRSRLSCCIRAGSRHWLRGMLRRLLWRRSASDRGSSTPGASCASSRPQSATTSTSPWPCSPASRSWRPRRFRAAWSRCRGRDRVRRRHHTRRHVDLPPEPAVGAADTLGLAGDRVGCRHRHRRHRGPTALSPPRRRRHPNRRRGELVVRPAIARLAVVLALGACASKVPPAEAAPGGSGSVTAHSGAPTCEVAPSPRQATWYARTTSMNQLRRKLEPDPTRPRTSTRSNSGLATRSSPPAKSCTPPCCTQSTSLRGRSPTATSNSHAASPKAMRPRTQTKTQLCSPPAPPRPMTSTGVRG